MEASCTPSILVHTISSAQHQLRALVALDEHEEGQLLLLQHVQSTDRELSLQMTPRTRMISTRFEISLISEKEDVRRCRFTILHVL